MLKLHNKEITNLKKLEIYQRRYLGSKTKLIPFLHELLNELNISNDVESILDIFAGTGVVGHSFNKLGKRIISNDLLYSNHLAHIAFLGNEKINEVKLQEYILDWNKINPINLEENYFSDNFADTYFSHGNCLIIGHIREEIERLFQLGEINFREKAYLVTALIYSLDKIANTVGHYDAYRKVKEDLDRVLNIEMLNIAETEINTNNKQYKMDSNELIRIIEADLLYIDPPYNSRQYSDNYHLLENLADWKRVEVFGVAKKMDRSHIKSKYSGKNAAEAFSDLINNAKAKYIIVSYNDMGDSGNSRSQATINDFHLLSALKSKGLVTIYNKSFNQFSATSKLKSKEDLKERFFLCEVGEPHQGEVEVVNLDKEDVVEHDVNIFDLLSKEMESNNIEKKKSSASNNKNKFVKSPLNYTGGKYRLLNQILPLLPSKIKIFYDVFCGGANVGINVEAEQIKCIDKNADVINLLQYIQSQNIDVLHNKLLSEIKKFNLSLTYQNGYEHYGVNSSAGLGSVNKEQYKLLKSVYNLLQEGEDKNLLFLLLIIYGFNNQIRFNQKGGFNLPVGKRDYNGNVQKNLLAFNKNAQEKNIEFLKVDFTSILNDEFNNSDFVYFDPPYLLGTASYNENSGWSIQDEEKLLNLLVELDKRHVKFAMSNVIEHKGEVNNFLKVACEINKWKIHVLNFNYNNSNYQSKAKEAKTIEVLVTNY